MMYKRTSLQTGMTLEEFMDQKVGQAMSDLVLSGVLPESNGGVQDGGQESSGLG